MSADRFEALRLLVTELVSNSVRHGGFPSDQHVRLRVDARGERVAVTVEDPGAGFRPPETAKVGDTSGWGLYLLDRMADRWGVEVADATRVWFELPRS